MALQTSHGAEASSTSSASTETTTSNSGSNTSPFSAAGSPPLILAFLAIGLFSAAMIIVFGWRRIQFARGLVSGGLPFEDESATTRIPLVRPKLWDIWNGREVSWTQVAGSEKGGHDAQLQWANIMPLSANAMQSTAVPESTGSTRSSAGPATLPQRDLLDRQPLVLRVWRRRKQRKHHEKSTSPSIPPSRLQVEVAILMPSQRYPIYVKEGKDDGRHREKRKDGEEITEYSIGVYGCTWD